MKKIDVLVIEDSSPDRLRLRTIMEEMGIKFTFAWDAKKQKVLESDSILKIIEDKNPKIIVLDLSWTVEDDRNIQNILFLDYQEIINFMEKIKKDNKNLSSGIEFLKNIEHRIKEKEIETKKIIVTTQFIPPVAYGLRFYINSFSESDKIRINIIHKWREEKKLRNLLSEI